MESERVQIQPLSAAAEGKLTLSSDPIVLMSRSFRRESDRLPTQPSRCIGKAGQPAFLPLGYVLSTYRITSSGCAGERKALGEFGVGRLAIHPRFEESSESNGSTEAAAGNLCGANQFLG